MDAQMTGLYLLRNGKDQGKKNEDKYDPTTEFRMLDSSLPKRRGQTPEDRARAAQGFDATGTAGIPVFKDKKMEATEQPSKAATKKGPSPKVWQDGTNQKRSKSNEASSKKRSKISATKSTKRETKSTATTTTKTSGRKRKSAEKDDVQQEAGTKPASAKRKNRSSESSTTSRKSEASIEILPTFSN
jgi:hypothetical protein